MLKKMIAVAAVSFVISSALAAQAADAPAGTSPAGAPATSATASTTPAEKAPAAALNDAQIAHIAYTAGELDIKAAELALKKTKNADVKAFAEDMKRDHTAVNDKALALCKKLNVTPADNDTSKSLVKAQDEKRADLEKLDGAAFDKAYVDNEVAYHKTVNEALEKTLIPGSTNKELKDLLETGLKIFQGHQEHAEALAAKLK